MKLIICLSLLLSAQLSWSSVILKGQEATEVKQALLLDNKTKVYKCSSKVGSALDGTATIESWMVTPNAVVSIDELQPVITLKVEDSNGRYYLKITTSSDLKSIESFTVFGAHKVSKNVTKNLGTLVKPNIVTTVVTSEVVDFDAFCSI